MGVVTELEPTWRQWVVLNVRGGCSRGSMVAEMAAKNFDVEFANAVISEVSRALEDGGDVESEEFARRVEGIGREIAERRAVAGQASRTHLVDGISVGEQPSYVGDASRFSESNVLAIGEQAVGVLVRLTKPEVFVLGNVLSADECEELIRRSERKLARSTTIDKQTGREITIANRTSSGTYFQLREDDFIARIDDRLSELLRWPVDRAEGIQILRYEVGGEYRPHFDYFPPDDPGSVAHVANGGQRIGTLVMYLNDVADGGETIFPEIGLSVVPRRGHAVYFGYCNSRNQVDPLTLHGGTPVKSGVKWIATKWLRQQRRT